MTTAGPATDRLSLLVYRTLLLGAAAVALAVGAAAGLDAVHVDPIHRLTEYWRAYGLLVFSALFAYLAAAPPGVAVLWVVVLFHKGAMSMTAVLLLRGGAEGAPLAATVDAALVGATLAALALRWPAARAVRAHRIGLGLEHVGGTDPADGRGPDYREPARASRTARPLATAHSVHVPHNTASAATLTSSHPR